MASPYVQYRVKPLRSQQNSDDSYSRVGPPALLITQLAVLALVAAAPWRQASVNYREQLYILWATLATVVVTAGTIVADRWWTRRQAAKRVSRSGSHRLAAKARPATTKTGLSRRLAVPPVCWVFLGLSIWATAQAAAIFEESGGPASVRLQRYLLGGEEPAVADKLQRLQPQTATTKPQQPPPYSPLPGLRLAGLNDEPPLHETPLAVSVEPLVTRSAAGMMAVVAAMIWLGSGLFAKGFAQRLLLGGLTALGVVVAIFGLTHVLSYQPVNVFGLRQSGSFGPFVSKNSAGCFLNIALSAALGWIVIELNVAKTDRDRRYDREDANWLVQFWHESERLLAQLSTIQIVSLIAAVLIFSAVIATASRGASISACAAIIVALSIMSRRSGNKTGLILAGMTAVLVAAAFLSFFQLSERLSARLQNEEGVHIEFEGRTEVWQVAVSTIRHFWSTGSGIGTFHFAHVPFLSEPAFGWYYHAENLYLEALSDCGVIPGLVTIAAVIAVPIWALRRRRGTGKRSMSARDGIRVTAASLLVTQTIHSTVDFSLIAPACFLPAALLLGAIYGDAVRRPKGAPVQSAPGNTRAGQRRSLTLIQLVLAVIALIVTMVFGGLAIGPTAQLAAADPLQWFQERQTKAPADQQAVYPAAILLTLWNRPANELFETPQALKQVSFALADELRRRRREALLAGGVAPAEAVGFASIPVMHVTLRTSLGNAVAAGGRELDVIPAPAAAINDVLGYENASQRWQRALTTARQARRMSPLDFELSALELWLSVDMPPAALDARAERMRFLNANYPEALYSTAMMMQSLGQIETALDLLHFPLRFTQQYALATAKVLAQWYADEDLPVDLYPSDPLTLLPTAEALIDLKRPLAAERLLTRADQILSSPGNVDARSYYLRAQLARLRDDPQSQLTALSEAVRRNPNEISWLQELIALAIRQKEFETAEKWIDRLRRSPQYEQTAANYQSQLRAIRNAPPGED